MHADTNEGVLYHRPTRDWTTPGKIGQDQIAVRRHEATKTGCDEKVTWTWMKS